MLTAITQSAQSASTITYLAPDSQDFRWLLYFNPEEALQSVINHIETLPGSRHERHTMRAYLGSLADYCGHLGARVAHYGGENYQFWFDQMGMPNRATTGDYIATLKKRGLSSPTITRYMAAVRLFLRALEEQSVNLSSGGDFLFVMEAQRQFRLAIAVKNPPPDRSSNRPALEQYGQRLQLAQVNQLFTSFQAEISTLQGKRDLAILYLGITSGLRAAEIARITVDSIQPGKDCYEIRVRGKRSNHDPIGVDSDSHALIMDYVTAWNNTLDESDPRRIAGDNPIFQPLLKGGHIPPLGHNSYDPLAGLSARSILRIVERRTQAALGKAITAHDMRRTCAYLMRSHGYEWDQIRAQLRHKSIGTTERYVGQEQDLSRALLSKRVTFLLPDPVGTPNGASNPPLEVQSC